MSVAKVTYMKYWDPVYNGQIFKVIPAYDLNDMMSTTHYDVYDLYGNVFDYIGENSLAVRYTTLNNLELAVLRALDLEDDLG